MNLTKEYRDGLDACAKLLSNAAASKWRWVDFDIVFDALEDAALARYVLIEAGFYPDETGRWVTGPRRIERPAELQFEADVMRTLLVDHGARHHDHVDRPYLSVIA